MISILALVGLINANGHAAEHPGLTVEAGNTVVRLEAWGDRLVHFEFSHASLATDRGRPIWTSPMVDPRNDAAGPTSYKAMERGFETAALRAIVDPASGCLEATDRARGVVLQKLCPHRLEQGWKALGIESPRMSHLYGLGQYFVNPGTADGDLRGRVLEPGPQGNELRGFNGGANTVSMFPILYLAEGGREASALFLDQTNKMRWDLHGNPVFADMFGDQIRGFVILGAEGDLKSARRDYLKLTGLPPVPPKSAMGLWVSEFGYDNWDEIRREIDGLDRAGFPVDGFALDIQWFGGWFYNRGDDTRGSRFGTLQFDPSRFPDARGEIRRLKERGISLMPIEESYVSRFLPEWERLREIRGMAWSCSSGEPSYLDSNPWWGVGGMIDWTNPEAGDFWHDLKRQPLIELGLTHHWTDLGEPEMYDEHSCYRGFPAVGPGGPKNRHSDIHNLFSLMWMDSIARGYERNRVRERPFMMARAAISGVQRTGAGMWSGDIAANMGALTAHLGAQMHMSLSGIDYYGSDVGGFHRRPDTLDGDADELFTQWFANSSLFDFPLRSHTWNLANNLRTSPASMGHVASNLANARRRYELHPYVYSLAHRAAEAGDPLVYPPLLDFPEDPRLREAGNLKMIGPSLLAAVSARYGELHRGVYLPRGEWIDFESRDWVSSRGQTLERAPVRRDGVFRIPLFARAGAIVPMARVDGEVRNISGLLRDGGVRRDLRVRVFGSREESTFTLAEDDGHTVDYRSGRVARTEIRQRLEGDSGAQVVSIGASVGDYDGKPARRDLTVELVTRDRRATSVVLDGAALAACGGGSGACWENPARNLVVVRIPNASTSEAHVVRATTEPVAATASAYFACHGGRTEYGTSVYVLGSLPELGAWDAARAVRLEPAAYPVWTGQIAGLPVGAEFEWQCIRRPESASAPVDHGPRRHARTSDSDYSGAHESHL